MKKRLVAFLLVLIMVLGMLPVSAFAADNGADTQALVSNEEQTIKYQILYVGDEFRIGYNYGESVSKTYICQYSEGHSGDNHSILISEIKNVGLPALEGQLDSGYEFVGWAKEAKSNPTIWDFNKGGTTATQTTYTIYLVAKKSNPDVTYTLTYDKNTTDTVTNMPKPNPQTAKNNVGNVTFWVSETVPVREGYTFKGWQTSDGTTVGPRVKLTRDNPFMTIYAVWEETPVDPPKPDKPEKPGTDDFGKTGLVAVVDSTGTHASETYDLEDKTFEIGDVKGDSETGYTCDVTVTADTYVAKYVSSYGAHTLVGDRTKTFTLTWQNETWTAIDGGVTFDVKCESQSELPEIDEARVGGSGFKFHCVTEGAQHNGSNNALRVTLREHPDAYTIDKTIKYKADPNGVNRPYFEVTVTDVAAYLPDFNYFYGEHEICEGEPETLTLTFWLLDSGFWSQWRTQTVNVQCVKAPEPPTGDKLHHLDTPVAVECVSGVHSSAGFDLTHGRFDVGDVELNNEGTYTCTLTIYAERYISEYSEARGTHRLADGEKASKELTLYWDAGKEQWTVDPQNPRVWFKATCAPDAPTGDKLHHLDTPVAVKCVSGVHVSAGFELTHGRFDVGDVELNNEGTYTCTLTIYAERYIGVYSESHGTHRLADGEEASKELTLYWDAKQERWNVDSKNPRVWFKATCVPDAPTADDVKAALGSVTVKCVNPTTGANDCTDVEYWAAGGNSVGEAVKVSDTQYTVSIGADAFVDAYAKKMGAHDRYSAANLTWVLNYSYEESKWVGTPETAGVDDTIFVTHAPQKWQEVGEISKGTGIKATCTTGSYGPIEYGLTSAFVDYNANVLSVVYESEGRYLATFKTDTYVEAIGKDCNKNHNETRSHRLTSGNETVQWYFTYDGSAWSATPKTAGTDDTITVEHAWRITFHPENGEADFVVEVFDCEVATKPTTPSKEGYTLGGWYTADHEQYTFTEAVTGDLDLYAAWAPAKAAAFAEDFITLDCVGCNLGSKLGHAHGAKTYQFLDRAYSVSKDTFKWDADLGTYTVELYNKSLKLNPYLNSIARWVGFDEDPGEGLPHQMVGGDRNYYLLCALDQETGLWKSVGYADWKQGGKHDAFTMATGNTVVIPVECGTPELPTLVTDSAMVYTRNELNTRQYKKTSVLDGTWTVLNETFKRDEDTGVFYVTIQVAKDQLQKYVDNAAKVGKWGSDYVVSEAKTEAENATPFTFVLKFNMDTSKEASEAYKSTYTKRNKTYSNWSWDKTTVTGSVKNNGYTVWATLPTVTVTFDPNGGEVTPTTKEVKIGETYGELPVPTRTGYSFDGWYTAAEDGDKVEATTTVTATTAHTLYAHWTLIPPAADSKPSYSGLKIKVDCTENKSGHTEGAYYYGLVIGLSDTSGFNEPENGWVEENGAYYYTITINKDVYVAKYANTTKTAHTENGENANEVKWQWNGTEWVLLNEKDDKGGVLTINVKCAEKQVVNVVIYRNGNTEKAYKTVALEKMPKGTVIDLSKLNIADYYTAECEFHGWFNDGAWNEYKKNPERAGLETITVNGWTNIICMVYDYEKVVYFQSAQALADYQADHSETEGLLFTTKARVGSALPTVDAPTATRDGYTFTYWSREGQSVDVTGQTVNGWTNLYANWEITPNKIYAYARLNSYFAPLTTSKFDTPVTLNEATLSRLGLGSYNSLGYVSIGSFTFDAMPLTSDLYFDDDAELSAVVAKLATDIALETGVSDKIAEKIAWTALYKTVNEEDMEPGYPAADGYQISGNLNLATVMFDAGGENVTGMPVDNYVYDDAVGIYDFYYTGDTFTLPTTEPTRAGYDFKGWEATVLDGEGTKLYQAGDTYEITAQGVKFTAKWEARNDTPYKVEHYLESLDGAYTLDTTEPLKGTTDTTATAAAKSYDNFTYDSTVPGTVTSGVIAGDGSLVLKLYYTRNIYDYTVRHIKQLPDGSYDEANAEVEKLSGKFEALATVIAKDYGPHYPTNDAATKQNIKIEKNLTIDVKYDLDYHTLTFDTDGGSAIDPVTVRHGNAVARPADPTKDKYTFIGWYVDPEFTEEYNFATVLEADKTIYAKFELTATPIGDIYVRYDVLHIKQLPDGSYDLANAEVEHLSAKKDTTVTAVVRDYSATHHINVNSTLSKLTDTAIQPYPGADGKPVYTILSVYYDLDFHTLTFDTMGGSHIDPVTVRHGNAVAKPADPVNGGYIFDGWYTDKTYRTPYNFATVLTQDTTIYAKWFLIALPGVTVKKAPPKLNTSDHFAYVQGYPDGTVKPTGNITRAETAAILFRLMDEGSRKTYYSTRSGFRDVATGSWYNTYVATLNNAGVITDSSNGYFRPNEAITRAELAAMLANFTETAGAANYFNDVSASYWAANAIAICAKLGWITGYPDGSFRPDRNVTRAELMAMINRATGRTPKSADAFLPGMKTWSDNTADKWYYLDVQEATNSHSYTVKDSEKWTALNSDPNWSLYE